ncbi:MAG: tyrosine-type recombinase/integrase [Nanoarchaeota archaeon]
MAKSLKYQVLKTLKANTVPEMSEKTIKSQKVPTSRQKAKEQGKDPDKHIYSYADFKRTLNTSQRLVEYAKEKYGIHNLEELTTEMTESYLKKKLNDGCEISYIRQELSRIRKLDRSLLWAGKRSKHDESIDPDIDLPSYSRSDRAKGHYVIEEVKKIMAYVKKKSIASYRVIEFQKETGARIGEALSLTLADIDFESQKIILTGKGNRSRKVEVSKDYLNKLKALVNKKEVKNKEKIFEIGKRNVQKQVEKACDINNIKNRGTHGFRGFAAYQLAKRYLTEKEIRILIKKPPSKLREKDREVLLKLSNFLGHNRTRIVRRHYLQR